MFPERETKGLAFQREDETFWEVPVMRKNIKKNSIVGLI